MVKEEKFLLNKDTGEVIDIKQEDFEFVQEDKSIHDVKFKSKATTFFKDSIKRFLKSKSALVGGVIVGILIVLSIIVPMCTGNVGCYNVDRNSVGGQTAEKYLQPKLFDAGTGFWDGTVQKTAVLFDKTTNTPSGYREGSFYNLETYEEYVNTSNVLGEGGYVGVFCADKVSNGNFYSPYIDFDLTEETYNIEIKAIDETLPDYLKTRYRVTLQDKSSIVYPLTDWTDNTSLSINVNDNIADISEENLTSEGKLSARIRIEVEAGGEDAQTGSFTFESVKISSSSTDEEMIALLDAISFETGNEVLIRSSDDVGYWNSTSGRTAYKVLFTYCNFTYDQYEDLYGNKEATVTAIELVTYVSNGDIDINFSTGHLSATTDKEELKDRFPILNEDNGIIVEVLEQIGDATYNASKNRYDGYTLKVILRGYRYYGYDSMPKFLFGTNSTSRDYLKLIFTSLRFSFLLSIGVSAINICIGLVWGSISGYFGGWVDILMERIMEIIGSIPTTVVITLCIMYGSQYNWGSASDVIALMLALFLTGWMGVAGRTRTQFYRFKGREYVLASRTLGAKDRRLIFSHILPNSMGTIITGSILMIPSVIYTEASIAYLGLGLSGQNMFGVILSEANTNYMGETTFILTIPTFIMALLLVSFNLFGNGLRDAFNPSLKGGEQ